MTVMATNVYSPFADSVMFSNLDKQMFMRKFESHWVSHSNTLVPHLGKNFAKFFLIKRHIVNILSPTNYAKSHLSVILFIRLNE